MIDALDDILRQLASGDRRHAVDRLLALVRGDRADAIYPSLCARLDDIADPQDAALFALAAGVVVERGAPPALLARALVEPLRDTLARAARLGPRLAALHDDAGTRDIGEWKLTDAAFAALGREDPGGMMAWFSLANWYKPAVTAWTRDRTVLREVQADAELCASLRTLGSRTESSHWLGLLVQTLLAAPLVYLFPEIEQAWALTADGVVDFGQLAALTEDALAEPLAAIGATGELEGDVLANQRGVGPQQGTGTYGCRAFAYPLEAFDPDTGRPRDGRARWRSRGGVGDQFLPMDFAVGQLVPRDGARVLLVVGPRAGGPTLVRSFGATRTFMSLPAAITDARRLAAADAARWFALADAVGRAGPTGEL